MFDVACCVRNVSKRTSHVRCGSHAWWKLLGRGVGEKLGLNLPPPPTHYEKKKVQGKWEALENGRIEKPPQIDDWGTTLETKKHSN